MASGEDLLEKMRRSPHDHGAGDFERLLRHYGFEKDEGSSHTIYSHELLPGGPVVVVPRHRRIRAHVARKAVSAIDSVIAAEERAKRQEAADGGNG